MVAANRGQVAAGQGISERMGLRQWRTDDRTGRGERRRRSQLALRSALQSGRPMELDPVAARAQPPGGKPRPHGPGLGLRGQHSTRGSPATLELQGLHEQCLAPRQGHGGRTLDQMSSRRHSVLPGFGLSMGITITYLSLLVLLPLSTIFFRSASLGWEHFWVSATSPRVLASYRLSFGASFVAAVINAITGLLVAWVLVRYRFPGRKLIDALVDLPFALPTAVAGIALTTLYGPNGWIGRWLEAIGIKVAFTPLGVAVALTFIGLPFVVRTVQPVLQDLEREIEEAAASLGASRWQTFRRVLLPPLMPALLTGFALAFARSVGEYGSVVFISGNMPMKTEIAPLLIMTKLEQFDYPGATAIAVVMLVFSFIILLGINLLQWAGRRRAAA